MFGTTPGTFEHDIGQAPDRALREKLYAHYLSDVETPDRAALIAYLADRAATSVREVIGVVNRLIAAADIAAMPLLLSVAKLELESAAPAHAPEVQAADNYFLDDEKIVWRWPDATVRLIEELR